MKYRFVPGKSKREDLFTPSGWGEDRGHEIILINNEWYFADDRSLADYERPCIKCNKLATEEGHDPCIANLPNVMFACCGHGNMKQAYLKLNNGVVYRQIESEKMNELCHMHKNDITSLMIALDSAGIKDKY